MGVVVFLGQCVFCEGPSRLGEGRRPLPGVHDVLNAGRQHVTYAATDRSEAALERGVQIHWRVHPMRPVALK